MVIISAKKLCLSSKFDRKKFSQKSGKLATDSDFSSSIIFGQMLEKRDYFRKKPLVVEKLTIDSDFSSPITSEMIISSVFVRYFH